MGFVFLDPRQGPSTGAVVPAHRLASLAGRRVGVLWNNRPGGDRLLRHLAQLLHQKYEFSEVYFTKKTFIGNAAPQEVIDDLATRVDAAIVGVGD
jgi:hypothetical protein